MDTSVLSLGFLQTGREAVIKDFNGGRNFHQRLLDLGLVRGIKVRVIKNDMTGPLIISIGEGRLAIGRGMALKIIVKEVNGSCL
ncbi:hypothetical protein H0A61_01803 [Koleobacter methoxysyntrophicus]|uniref:Ferrous iron transporter FeoA-like domain-containing protein n=1 Tax=Koleobacter methoxysyntrophicus TaxID=2751313 RepID=A0A8A0RPE2_9FIRM|nr:FeoA domain-containing protein [Koleobacter methoxysyntrophicus]QSQ09440.1 hypothetical protein H0A61_01803 [Koleobacter methoxysyntrophicus]